MSASGIVFNIQRFSVHDGPGIRTTVFLKGCSLHCFWCHNPEGISPKQEIQFYPERCIGCGACLERVSTGRTLWRMAFTSTCAINACSVANVPTAVSRALEMTGDEVTVDDVMQEVLADRTFYQNSGGGMTLSGGEPLLQKAFSKALLERAKAEGVHTAIETCGNYRWSGP